MKKEIIKTVKFEVINPRGEKTSSEVLIKIDHLMHTISWHADEKSRCPMIMDMVEFLTSDEDAKTEMIYGLIKDHEHPVRVTTRTGRSGCIDIQIYEMLDCPIWAMNYARGIKLAQLHVSQYGKISASAEYCTINLALLLDEYTRIVSNQNDGTDIIRKLITSSTDHSYTVSCVEIQKGRVITESSWWKTLPNLGDDIYRDGVQLEMQTIEKLQNLGDDSIHIPHRVRIDNK